MNKALTIAKTIARIAVGVTFIISAILKLQSIDAFEIYAFGFQLFSFNIISILVRLLIGIELFIGIALIIKIYYKQIWLLTFFALIAFSIFLCFLAFSNPDDNCHCFGSKFELTPVNSLIKNAILILLLLFATSSTLSINLVEKYKKLIFTFSILGCIIIPFFTSIPDFLSESKKNKTFNQDAFSSVIKSNEQLKNIAEGKKLVCLFGSSCRFCKLSGQKIEIFRLRHQIDSTKICHLFWGDEKSISEFHTETKSSDTPYFILNWEEFESITSGAMPIIVCLENGIVKRIFNYRNLDEEWIKEYLK